MTAIECDTVDGSMTLRNKKKVTLFLKQFLKRMKMYWPLICAINDPNISLSCGVLL